MGVHPTDGDGIPLDFYEASVPCPGRLPSGLISLVEDITMILVLMEVAVGGSDEEAEEPRLDDLHTLPELEFFLAVAPFRCLIVRARQW